MMRKNHTVLSGSSPGPQHLLLSGTSTTTGPPERTPDHEAAPRIPHTGTRDANETSCLHRTFSEFLETSDRRSILVTQRRTKRWRAMSSARTTGSPDGPTRRTPPALTRSSTWAPAVIAASSRVVMSSASAWIGSPIRLTTAATVSRPARRSTLTSSVEGLGKKDLDRMKAIIQSMTNAERENPNILNASRRKRIAAGSGQTVQSINQLIKQFDEMKSMMKKFNNPAALKKNKLFRGLMG